MAAFLEAIYGLNVIPLKSQCPLLFLMEKPVFARGQGWLKPSLGKIIKLENINSQFQNLPQISNVQTECHQYGVDLKRSEDCWKSKREPHACGFFRWNTSTCCASKRTRVQYPRTCVNDRWAQEPTRNSRIRSGRQKISEQAN